jgi:hypothetical protein
MRQVPWAEIGRPDRALQSARLAREKEKGGWLVVADSFNRTPLELFRHSFSLPWFARLARNLANAGVRVSQDLAIAFLARGPRRPALVIEHPTAL